MGRRSLADPFTFDERALPGTEPDIVLAPEDDVRAHAGLGNHKVIGIAFPKWRDGRGYSSARILRELGFTGDIRAIGDLTVDQLIALRRSGFSSLAPERPIDPEVARQTLARFPYVYQRATDAAQPAWALRHAKEEAQ